MCIRDSYWPYAHPTIGSMEDLEKAQFSAVREFWEQYYGPNNAVLSVAGDFDPEEALGLIERYFGDIPPRPTPPYEPPSFNPPQNERRDVMQDPLAEVPAIHIAWHIPPNREPDHYPLEMLALLLGHGQSSRLYRKLVHDMRLLGELEISTDDRRGPDLFSLFGILTEGHGPEEVERVVYEEIERVGREGPTPREFERIRNQVRSLFYFPLQNNLNRAKLLAEFEMYYGDAELIRTELDRYLAVRPEDIQRVAREYLTPVRRTVLHVMPERKASREGGKP
ncbi:MAG: insulinase family protein, partial [Deltaproteobacteria bacterium]|nr:insulinase family protein [Deltaproteobacteria bacterium]